MSTFSGHRDLLVWKESYELTKEIYQLTKFFPKEELYGITSQMRRAAVSIPSNIAEGYRRFSKASQLQFCLIAYGSATELETQLELSNDLQLSKPESFDAPMNRLKSVLCLLNRYCGYLQRTKDLP
jgi:four helix bundle protein